MGRHVVKATGLLVSYVALSSFLHFVVFPEPTPPLNDRPRRGTEVHLPGGSTFVYRITALESDGQLFEAEWLGKPGAGIVSHTHPSQEVRIAMSSGSLLVALDGAEQVVGFGESVAIPAGVAHRWENASGEPARGLFQIRPAGMADFVFVQLDRAFGGEASAAATAVQTFILIGTHGKHTAWPIEVLRFLVAPTARLFGLRSYYEPVEAPAPSAPSRTGMLGHRESKRMRTVEPATGRLQASRASVSHLE